MENTLIQNLQIKNINWRIQMNQKFILLSNYQYQMECTCTNPEHILVIQLNKGDTLTLSKGKKYIDGIGWCYSVVINRDRQLYMFSLEVDQLYLDGVICSKTDLLLKINYATYKVNQSLDHKDKALFKLYAEELEQLKEIEEISNCKYSIISYEYM